MSRPVWLIATVTALALAAGAARGPVVVTVDGLAVGEFRRGRWIDPGAALPAAGKLRFTELGLGRAGRRGFEDRLIVSEGSGALVFPGARPARGVFLTGRKPAFRPVTPAPDALNRRMAAVRRALRARGVTSAPVLRSAYRVDLDGDGRPETVLSVASRATLRLGAPPRRGDFSALFVFPGRGAPRVEPAFFGSYRGESSTDLWFFEVRAIADVGGDGALEIVLGTGYHLGPGGAVLQHQRGRTTVVAQAMNDEP